MMNKVGMKKYGLGILGFIVSVFQVFGPDELLSPIGRNAALEHFAKQDKINIIYNNFILSADTLSLPFIEDFSVPSLKPYDFAATQINDTVFFATGSCVLNGDFNLTNGFFNTSQTYSYFFDTITDQIDSVPNLPLTVQYYDGADCFSQVS